MALASAGAKFRKRGVDIERKVFAELFGTLEKKLVVYIWHPTALAERE